jgi:ParB family transcriptional regulator, chromosome partitioning protein
MEPVVRKIALNKLVLSPANARETPASSTEDAELKASIKTRGLKQNPVVHPSADDNGIHAVTAGGRRLKALQELAAEGVIPADYKVPCLVEEPDEALETSLMENTARAVMHPADEFVAMAGLIDTGQLTEAVATRFGVSERYVKQRLRLGKVAPELLHEFRAGTITLEVMMAFTLAVDHKSQLAVWRQVKAQPYVSAHAVRRLLTQGAAPVDSRLGTFIGRAAYEAARGTVRCDLFSTREEGFMDDAALVRRLAIEKLEGKAQELRSSWAWARPMLDPDYGFTAEYRRLRPKPPKRSRGSRSAWRRSTTSPRTVGTRFCGQSRPARGTPRSARRGDTVGDDRPNRGHLQNGMTL